jgi:hypothetical protein
MAAVAARAAARRVRRDVREFGDTRSPSLDPWGMGMRRRLPGDDHGLTVLNQVLDQLLS